jgi:hypothetical protein
MKVQETIHHFLDGNDPGMPAELQAHCGECASCQSLVHAAFLLRHGTQKFPTPSLPSAWTDKMVNLLLADVEASRSHSWLRRYAFWFALTASFLGAIAVLAWSMKGQLGPHVVSQVSTKQDAPVILPPAKNTDVSPVSVDQSLSEARSMVVSLTRRTADDAVEPTRRLLPTDAPSAPMPVQDTLPKSMEPAAQSLEEIRHGASSSFEPMANSAVRAINMFWNEVPPKPERKPDF